jgi:hypothetical protein
MVQIGAISSLVQRDYRRGIIAAQEGTNEHMNRTKLESMKLLI